MLNAKRLAGTLIALLLLVVYAGCAATETRRTTGTYIDDKTISTKVKTALATDPMTKATQVNVETFRGVVQLSGFVDSQASIERAIEIARGVEGVRDVKSGLALRGQTSPGGGTGTRQ